jgi:hypothetical protein
MMTLLSKLLVFRVYRQPWNELLKLPREQIKSRRGDLPATDSVREFIIPLKELENSKS